MSCSDNVLRAGLTSKHRDRDALLQCLVEGMSDAQYVDPLAAGDHTRVFTPPDLAFALSVTRAAADGVPLPAGGHRMVICIEDAVEIVDRPQRGRRLLSSPHAYPRAGGSRARVGQEARRDRRDDQRDLGRDRCPERQVRVHSPRQPAGPDGAPRRQGAARYRRARGPRRDLRPTRHRHDRRTRSAPDRHRRGLDRRLPARKARAGHRRRWFDRFGAVPADPALRAVGADDPRP